jgi:hypothetical protein
MTWVKSFVVMVAVLGVIAFVYAPFSFADEWADIPQKIREAKTPADHQALAAFYEKEAQKAHQLHTTHASMAAAYSAARSMQQKDQAGGDMVFVAKKYQEMAKEYESLAAIHKTMAEQVK